MQVLLDKPRNHGEPVFDEIYWTGDTGKDRATTNGVTMPKRQRTLEIWKFAAPEKPDSRGVPRNSRRRVFAKWRDGGSEV